MHALVIINPAAGSRRVDRDRVRRQQALAERALATRATADVRVTERPGHATTLARDAVNRGVDLVVVWGGDGTVNEAVQALAFTGVPLAVVPAGSGNGFARELGIAAQPARAFAQALEAPSQVLDVGEIGGRLFANLAGVGLDAAIARAFNARRGRTHGLATYAWLSVLEVCRYDASRYTIELDDETLDERATLVALANSAQYGNGARVAPDARPDDGWLDLVVVRAAGPLATLWRARRLFDGRIADERGVTMRRVRRVRITAHGLLHVHVDGEPLDAAGRLDARVHAGALVVKGGRP